MVESWSLPVLNAFGDAGTVKIYEVINPCPKFHCSRGFYTNRQKYHSLFRIDIIIRLFTSFILESFPGIIYRLLVILPESGKAAFPQDYAEI